MLHEQSFILELDNLAVSMLLQLHKYFLIYGDIVPSCSAPAFSYPKTPGETLSAQGGNIVRVTLPFLPSMVRGECSSGT